MDPRKELSELLQAVMATAQHEVETLKKIKGLMQDLIKLNQQHQSTATASTQVDPLVAMATGLDQINSKLDKKSKSLAKISTELAYIKEGEVAPAKISEAIDKSLKQLDQDSRYLANIQGNLQPKVALLLPQQLSLIGGEQIEKMQQHLQTIEEHIGVLNNECNRLKKQAGGLGMELQAKEKAATKETPKSNSLSPR